MENYRNTHMGTYYNNVTRFALAFLTACFFSGCKHDVIALYKEDRLAINQLIVDASSGKASIDEHNIKWSHGDKIGVFSNSAPMPSAFSIISGVGESRATFEGNAYLQNAVAKYPYMPNDTFDGLELHTFIEPERSLVAGMDSLSLVLAANVQEDGTVVFKNLSTILCVPLKGNGLVNRIQIQAVDSETIISGDMLITFDENGVCYHPNPHRTTAAGNESIMYGHIQLDENEISNVYIGVPPQKYRAGFTISIYTEDGFKITRKIDRDLDLKGGGVYSVDPIAISHVDKVSASQSLSGRGSAEDPFKISSLEDLLYFRDVVNSQFYIISSSDYMPVEAKYAHVELTSDIDLSYCCGPEIGDWIPISNERGLYSGRYDVKFEGKFDGKFHKIKGLYISDYHLNGGLFGILGEKSTVCNLEIEGEIFAGDSGLLCYESDGLLESIITHGMIKSQGSVGGVCYFGEKLVNCVNYADVTADDRAGGLVGIFNLNGGTTYIQNCANYGDVTSIYASAAGVVAHVNGWIYWSNYTNDYVINCANYGTVTSQNCAGGIAGIMGYAGKLYNCINFGTVQITDPDPTNVAYFGCGGICAYVGNFLSSEGECRIVNCINIGKISGHEEYTGAIVGANIQHCSNSWWLNESSGGMDFGGPNLGDYTSALSDNQLKGKEEFGNYYKYYDDLVDALNDWAYNNPTPDYPLNGWEYGRNDGWPSIKQAPAVPPIQGDQYLVTPTEFYSFNTYSHPFSLFVSSSSEVSISLPSWIKLNETKEGSDPTNHDVTFELTVEKNNSGARRREEIVLSNIDDCRISVIVDQSYTLVSEDYSRNGNVVQVQSAKRGNGIDLVFMGDGYLDKDIQSGKYDADMRRAVEAFFDVEPYTSFRDMFNVSYVELVSESNLFDGSMSTSLDGYFGEGTRVGGNDNIVIQYCQNVIRRDNLDDVTAIIVLNERRYSGTCYMYYNNSTDYGLGFAACYFALGTASTGTTSMESVLRHEAGGHGFAKLADEYAYIDYGRIPDERLEQICELQNYGWYSNVDRSSDPFQVSWTHFLQKDEYEVEGIGVYEGAATYWSGIYRPTYNSIMNNNTGGFNAPSREAIYYKIHKLAYGPSWNYDRNEFYEYDKINLNTTKSSSFNNTIDDGFIPLHSPVIVK